jgi:hypothetical protein
MDALSRSLADASSRRRLLTLLGIGAAGSAVTAVGLNEAFAKTNKTINASSLKNIPVQASRKGQKFKGQLNVTEFRRDGDSVVAIAQLTGKVDKKQGNGKKKVNRTVTLPVQLPASTGVVAQASCEILDLVLGPLDLNLLGLKLHIDKIVINLTAQSGPGNLLGNLLCAIANLLNGPDPLSDLLGQIVELLNQILGALG